MSMHNTIIAAVLGGLCLPLSAQADNRDAIVGSWLIAPGTKEYIEFADDGTVKIYNIDKNGPIAKGIWNINDVDPPEGATGKFQMNVEGEKDVLNVTCLYVFEENLLRFPRCDDGILLSTFIRVSKEHPLPTAP